MAASASLEGWASILAALVANRRAINIIYLPPDKAPSSFEMLEQWAACRQIPARQVAKDVIAAHTNGQSQGHALFTPVFTQRRLL